MFEDRHVAPHALGERLIHTSRRPAYSVRGAGDHQAPRVADQGMPVGHPRIVVAIEVPAMAGGRHQPALCLDRPCSQQHLPMVPAGLQREGRGQEDDLSARTPQLQEQLREADIVADGEAEGDVLRLEGHHLLPRLEDGAFAIALAVGRHDVEEVDFAVAGDFLAVRAEDQRRVVEPVPGQLPDRAAMDIDRIAARDFPQELIGFATGGVGAFGRQLLGFAELRLPVAAEAGPHLREGDEPRPPIREGALDQLPRLGDVLPLLGARIHLDRTDTHVAAVSPLGVACLLSRSAARRGWASAPHAPRGSASRPARA